MTSDSFPEAILLGHMFNSFWMIIVDMGDDFLLYLVSLNVCITL
jgi:hypothetical protein